MTRPVSHWTTNRNPSVAYNVQTFSVNTRTSAGQLSLLSSAGREMSTSQKCGDALWLGVKAGCGSTWVLTSAISEHHNGELFSIRRYTYAPFSYLVTWQKVQTRLSTFDRTSFTTFKLSLWRHWWWRTGIKGATSFPSGGWRYDEASGWYSWIPLGIRSFRQCSDWAGWLQEGLTAHK